MIAELKCSEDWWRLKDGHEGLRSGEERTGYVVRHALRADSDIAVQLGGRPRLLHEREAIGDAEVVRRVLTQS